MTRVVIIEKTGGPEVLNIETINLSEPKPEEVQIEQVSSFKDALFTVNQEKSLAKYLAPSLVMCE